MLTYEEETLASEVLLRFVTTSGGNARYVLMPKLENRFLQSLIQGSDVAVVAHALRMVMDDGYRLAPPAIVRLLDLVSPFDGRIPPLIARLSVPPPAAAPSTTDPFLDALLYSKLPFLERTATRNALKGLLGTNPLQPFVVINGMRKLGKSYTVEFIRHAIHRRATMGASDVILCVIEAPPNQLIGPEQVARDLVISMGGRSRDEPPRQTDTDQWCRELANWVVETGLPNEQNWWVVLDGFNGARLRPETRAFIGKLAAAFINGLATRRFRLILLDFDHTALPVTPGTILVDQLGAIPKTSVKAFLDLMFAGVANVNALDVYEEVTGDLNDPIEDLPELAQRLGDAIELVEQGA